MCKMTYTVAGLMFRLAIIACCCLGGYSQNLTDTNLSPMALTGSPIIVNSGPICPSDSELVGDICHCNVDLCEPPPCDKFLNLVRNGTDTPGNCCDVYSCNDCFLEVSGNGTCPCAEGAFLNDKGFCECSDVHKTLVNGECVCDPDKCELPLFCDIHSVPIKVQEGCCVKIQCLRCPEDSYSKEQPSDEIEPLCVCYTCSPIQCNETHEPVILRRGRSIPNECCDIYKCEPKYCMVNNNTYNNGEWWLTDDQQNCTCQNGISICDKPPTTESPRPCLDGNTSHPVAYPHLFNWLEDHCMNCTCNNGVKHCIADNCASRITNTTKYKNCSYGDQTYFHSTTWWVADICTNCTCDNGTPKCETDTCNDATTTEFKIFDECPPLEGCRKICRNGFKTNRKGCSICKCKMPERTMIEKYIQLDIYMREHNLTENDALELLREKASEKYEIPPTITTYENQDILIYVVPIFAFCGGVFVCIAAMKFWKNKCTYQYSPVMKPIDNNNLPLQGDILGDIKYISEKSPLKT